jgi:hypothetical protein
MAAYDCSEEEAAAWLGARSSEEARLVGSVLRRRDRERAAFRRVAAELNRRSEEER